MNRFFDLWVYLKVMDGLIATSTDLFWRMSWTQHSDHRQALLQGIWKEKLWVNVQFLKNKKQKEIYILDNFLVTFWFIWLRRNRDILVLTSKHLTFFIYMLTLGVGYQVSTIQLLSSSSAFHLLSTNENRWDPALKKLNQRDPAAARFEPSTDLEHEKLDHRTTVPLLYKLFHSVIDQIIIISR